ncbi:MAG: rod shape-determining protein MreC [Flavobacteriaceae bacterium CG18_big_fil_WC_8_21_14_2_50_34_36]|nr:MAG: rod shape-determining protein MreC [Flavobacteriaceae bacterium CG18_big_fil_WC_8_21_14_2_50_34_36]PIV49255.1 MAG: rod shape-determining protein MreC [Flavobacteriaceae bacterium CG02_land_8_20_14_3_00_34_13]PIZ07465.1 MAG: rod shape-determining protein MreC [Flavobacteriaceae bacterium CG_4_10_14_0_8_um_filter_34_31]PJC06318.1 MAG: rod shape-determining protein MreC [Flavobacteriaceae bacterium CG_4_9_14_0_8_um_filter_34_30]
MQQIINFFIRNKNFLLFLFLLTISLSLTIQSHSYHQSKFVHSANFVTGNLFSLKHEITGYFGLRKENELLAKENNRLRNQLEQFSETSTMSVRISDSLLEDIPYTYRTAEVINNNYSKTNNYLTLNSGRKQGIQSEMGVITSEGIVGIVDQVSENFSTVLSILNSKSSISVKLKKSGHFGSLVWDGKLPNTLQLIDVARLADISIGDTVTTDGRSTIFPKGLPVGVISGFNLDQGENFYIIDVVLFNDMTKTEHVYIIENRKAEEIKELEKTTKDE